ncbi:unnamed protein product [Orchesella dallaii]|uniref:Uncharacterized protein n=1 Tax=Orchesella dallaii TaxID=48710 RepID=A0ABP1PTV7_9HEXA
MFTDNKLMLNPEPADPEQQHERDSTLNPTTPTNAPLDLTQPSFKPKSEWSNIPKPSIDPIAIARFHAEEIRPVEKEEVEEKEEEEEEDEDDETVYFRTVKLR